jgi:hypothetical protein
MDVERDWFEMSPRGVTISNHDLFLAVQQLLMSQTIDMTMKKKLLSWGNILVSLRS